LSVVVVNHEGGDWLVRCLRSLSEQGVQTETIVVDNGSLDGSAAVAAARFTEVQLVEPGRNLGFAAGANAGARRARGEYILFLNPDVELVPGCLRDLLMEFEDPRVAVVGPSIRVMASGDIEYGATTDPFGYPVALHRVGSPLYVPGCALMIRAEVFRAVGGFDPRFFMFVEDVDLCWRVLLAGWDVRVVPKALVFHAGGAAAPGGYLTPRGLRTTRFRVALRERNTLAMLLKCYGPVSLGLVLLPYLLQSVATAAFLALAGKPRTSADVVLGLVWNARELPRTLALRRQVQARRAIVDRVMLGRMHRGFQKARLAYDHGMPSVVEA
jgi:GT2 family glycosyltransferase